MKLSTKEKILRIIDAMLYGDFTTKKYLYGIVLFSLITLVTGIMAIFGAGIWFGLAAMLVGVVDLIWWQSMTLTANDLKEQGSKERYLQDKKTKKLEKEKEKAEEKARKEEEKRLKNEPQSEVEKALGKAEEGADENAGYRISSEEIKYVLKKYKAKKDHREIIIDSCESLGLKEAPAYIWADKKKYYFLILGDGEPLKLDYPLEYNLKLHYEVGVKANPDAEYKKFKGVSVVAIAFADGSKRSLATLQELSIFLELHQEDFQKGDIKLTVLRDGKKESFTFSPYRDPESGRYRLGVQLKNGRVKAKNPLQVIEYSYYEFRFNARIVFDSLAMILRGKVSRQDVMGPVGTVAVIGGAVQQSSSGGLRLTILVLMNLSLMLSVNLGIMNLLPIPALDGGRLLFILFEMLLRKRLNPKWEERINTVGMAILLLLMVAIVFNDVFNLFTGVYSKLLK